ncbi:MAG: MurT ligase domain-containing protein [Desulfitobacteriaceae bacterium]
MYVRTWNFWLALWAGKLSGIILKLLGKKGTTLPGLIAYRLDSSMIKHLAKAYTEGLIMITGTNGKTTTANLLANILTKAGKKFAFNQAGANLVTGITGALLQNTGWRGKARVRLALLEVDEATVPKFCAEVLPDLVVVTNFFRDQLDRYGELDTTIRMVKNALSEKTLLILNADDPLVAQFGFERSRVLYYGVARTPESQTESQETREAKFCPECGQALDYELFHYGQLGIYACRSCNFKRPDPDVLADQVKQQADWLKFKIGSSCYVTALQGYYNLYNSLAAITVARQLNISEVDIEQGLREFIPQAGRMERFNFPEGELTLTLVKNPTGFNQVIRTVLASGNEVRLLIALNDLAADGRDISWLWDVDFERLGEQAGLVRQVVCSGLRAEEIALRLKYAGLKLEKLVIEHSLDKAVEILLSESKKGEVVFALPTYTNLFPLRQLLTARLKTIPTLVSRNEGAAEK